jgi:polar amino acid transport system substrate-binding protein
MTAASRTRRGRRPLARLAAAAVVLASAGAGFAEAPPARPPGPPKVAIPNYWDPKRRPERPNLGELKSVRFVTENDYPPFNFLASDGTLVGFNVELARAVCVELKLTCTIQPREWESLIPSLKSGEADAVIAGIAITARARREVDFSDRYLQNPARFVARNGAALDPSADLLAGKHVGVVGGTSHEQFLRGQFRDAAITTFPSVEEARRALTSGELDAVFADGVGLSIWLNGEEANGCCRFIGGPYTESFYFGEGIAIALRQGNDTLRYAINYALAQLYERGVYAELYLRYFPISFY